MQIARMMGTSTASALEAVYAEEERKQKQAKQPGALSWQQDSISISPEAMNAYQMMRINLMDKPSQHGLTQDEIKRLGKTPHEGPTAGSAFGTSSGSSVTSLQSRLKELQQQLVQVQNSGMPEETKAAKTASIMSQINEIMQELQKAKA